MTFMQAFNKIQERMSENAKITTDKDFFAVQVKLTNKDCSGIFYIKYENGKLSVEPYDYYDNNVAISLSYLTFNKLIDGRTDLTSGITSGNINATGDLSVAEALFGIVPAEKKSTAKKSKDAKSEKVKQSTVKPESAAVKTTDGNGDKTKAKTGSAKTEKSGGKTSSAKKK